MSFYPAMQATRIAALLVSLCCPIPNSTGTPHHPGPSEVATSSPEDGPKVDGPKGKGKPAPSKRSKSVKVRRSSALNFDRTNYFFRYTTAGLYEFTPAGQDVLGPWADMLSINISTGAKNEKTLKLYANRVENIYIRSRGTIIRTGSVPRTQQNPAEHFVAVKFQRDEFAEFAQARFLLVGNVGVAVVLSHRVYGKSRGEKLNRWIKNNGAALERELMAWDEIPTHQALSRLSP